MSEVAYSQWGLIPHDDDVLNTAPTSMHPPLLGNLALDMHSSLVFRLAAAPDPLQVCVVTTAFSAADANRAFQLLTGPTVDRYRPLDETDWQLQYDGPFAHCLTRISGAEKFIKLHCCSASSIVLTSVHFS